MWSPAIISHEMAASRTTPAITLRMLRQLRISVRVDSDRDIFSVYVHSAQNQCQSVGMRIFRRFFARRFCTIENFYYLCTRFDSNGGLAQLVRAHDS